MSDALPTRKERQAETRRRLFTAAARVFTAKGFHGASVSEIARTAGFTTGAVYANFDSKEQLFIELIDRHLAAQSAEVDALAADGDPDLMRQRLQDRVERLMTGLTQVADLSAPAGEGDELTTLQVQTLTLELLLYAVRERPDLRRAIAERYRAADARVTEVIRTWLEAEGRASALAPEDLAVAQSWLVEGLALRLLMDPELMPPARAAELYRVIVAELPLRDG